jgi:hypothetical protein
MKSRVLILIFASGILFGLAVISAGWIWLRQPHQLITTLSASGTFSRVIDTGLVVGPLVVELIPSVSIPESVEAEVAFPVSVILRPIAIYPAGREKFYQIPGNLLSHRDPVRMLTSHLSMTLHVAGAKVEPSTMEQMNYEFENNALTAKWSVLLSKPGEHNGFIRTTLTEPNANTNDRGVIAQFQKDADIRIRVLDTKSPFSDALARITVIAGILIALTNLIAFVWRWVDRSRQLTLEREADRGIVLP